MSMSARQLRQLEEIESELELSQPQLTAMFDIFSDLTSGERPNGAELLTRRKWWAPAVSGWSQVACRPEVLGLLILIVVVTLGALFSSGAHSVPRQCLTASVQSQPSSPAVFGRSSSMPAAPGCPGYITSK